MAGGGGAQGLARNAGLGRSVTGLREVNGCVAQPGVRADVDMALLFPVGASTPPLNASVRCRIIVDG
jgi:hypothetical protein